MRSRTGCLTCRQRKLKCDERKPICGQCCKASRECIPSSGIVFRHQHNASMNGGDCPDENNLKGFYAYKNTFDDEAIWLDIPKNVTFFHTTNPYLDPLTPELDTMSIDSIDSPAPFDARPNPGSWIASGSMPTMTSTPPSVGPDFIPTSAPGGCIGFSNSPMLQSPTVSSSGTPISPPTSLSNYPILPPTLSPPPIDPRLTSPFDSPIGHGPSHRTSSTSAPRSNSNAGFEAVFEQDHETSFLLRHFSEGPGYWMDLFDLGSYFSSYVPIKARENPLLKHAALAYSAKALSRVQRKKPTVGCGVKQQTRMELYPDTSPVDWYHKATRYYDTAVSLLLQALKNDALITPDSDSESEPRRRGAKRSHEQNVSTRNCHQLSSLPSFQPSTDDLLAATAILCKYEFLDNSVPEWARHLDGAKSLLVIAQESMMPLKLSTPNGYLRSNLGFNSKARKATFWNIARQDMLAAFIKRSRTRLNTEDLPLWREAGLLIDAQGLIIPNSASDTGYCEGENMVREGLICNGLVWLMSKLVNFMAAGDSLPIGFGRENNWDDSQRSLVECWHRLKLQFQTWHDGLPIPFQPCARMESSRVPAQLIPRGNELSFPEVWYSMPMCAAAMQFYHMSQIQLLMNKPPESTQGRTSVVARLNSYQSVLAALQVHSREIVSISLARSDDAVRIQSVQPLFTAGQCLTDPKERQLVIKLLQGIEEDIGWATDYRVRQLIDQWQFEESQEVHIP